MEGKFRPGHFTGRDQVSMLLRFVTSTTLILEKGTSNSFTNRKQLKSNGNVDWDALSTEVNG
jgi:hypothetical protein